MFLRFTDVVSQSGVWVAVAIVAVSKLITVLTSLSLSSIATNTRVEGGGAYYLISRSLGVEFGGAIGLVFFLAQAISVAMYVLGFAEAFGSVFAFAHEHTRVVASFTNALVFACVYIGAGWTIKVQYVILAILGASLASFYVGAFGAFDPALLRTNLAPEFTLGENAFTMFALFFPAVTGIMAGANMSGELRDPGRSIPRGTIAAVAVTGAIYISQAVLLGGARTRGELGGEGVVIASIAAWPILITAGVFAATLSSALGSMMGAPRILQAFARDNIFQSLRVFSPRSGKAQEPRRATILTFVIAQVCIVAADLDTIAPLITMAFLITYGLLNLATFYEAITKNPSYRPRFRFNHPLASLAGALGCAGVMVLIDARWALVATFGMFLLHRAIGRREIEARWGDVHSGLLFERARRNLLRLEDSLYHPKNWRPILLALSGATWNRPHLAVYGHWLTTGHGILSLGQVIQGEVHDRISRRVAQERILHDFVRTEQIEAFPAVVVAPTLSDGIEMLTQCQGLGALRPNTLLLGWPTSAERAESFGATIRVIAALERSIVAVRFSEEPDDPWEVPQGTLDVWWRGYRNGELMLLLAHLLHQNDEWRTHRIRLLRVIENEAGRDEVRKHLDGLIESSRIRARSEVVVSTDVADAIQRTSRDAAVVFLGFEAPDEGAEIAFFEQMERFASRLPRVVFVDSVGGMSLES